MIIAGTFITFASVSLLTWGVDFAVNYKSFSIREAAVVLSSVALLSLLLGVLTGGFVADRLQKRFAYDRIIVIAAALLCAAPFVLLAIQPDEKWVVLAALFIAGFFMSWYHGPVTAVLLDLTPHRAHSTSIGAYMFVTQLVGAFGPHPIGHISNVTYHSLSLQL